MLLQSHKKWRDAYAVVTKSCVRCYELAVADSAGDPIRLVELAEDAEVVEAQLELLPDYARRSRHIELYSFCVKTATAVAEPEPEHGPGDGGLLMAVRSAPAMWEWALKIRWRDELPVPERPPPVTCYLATHHDDHFSVPSVLQSRLLHIMTYKRIGVHNVRIEVRTAAGSLASCGLARSVCRGGAALSLPVEPIDVMLGNVLIGCLRSYLVSTCTCFRRRPLRSRPTRTR